MKKPIKLTISIVLALLVLAVSIWAYPILKEPFLRKVLVSLIQSQVVSGTPDWKTYNSPEGGLSIESPFPMKWEKSEQEKNGKNSHVIYGLSRPNRSGFHVYALYVRFTNKRTMPIYLKGVENLKGYETYKNFQRTAQPITCSGMPATLINYSFDSNGNQTSSIKLCVANKNQCWIIDFNSLNNNLNNYSEWTKRVIESIKFEPKNQ